MAKDYSKPSVMVLGEVTDLTLNKKPGVYFDLGTASEGSKTFPPPTTPGTIS